MIFSNIVTLEAVFVADRTNKIVSITVFVNVRCSMYYIRFIFHVLRLKYKCKGRADVGG